MHLLKYLAQAGIASRRQSEKLVKDGVVSINGRANTDPAAEVGPEDRITVQGKTIRYEPREYFMVHKPLGVISTAQDTHRRRTVVELVPSDYRLYPVGRLDADTTGLILLTNDGELANRLIHPRFEVPKTYRATVAGVPTKAALQRLRDGVMLEDGPTAPAAVSVVKSNKASTVLDITIHEGRNHQVRNMCQAIGHSVRKLQRTSLGSLKLGTLKEGAYRALTDAEINGLRTGARTV